MEEVRETVLFLGHCWLQGWWSAADLDLWPLWKADSFPVGICNTEVCFENGDVAFIPNISQYHDHVPEHIIRVSEQAFMSVWYENGFSQTSFTFSASVGKLWQIYRNWMAAGSWRGRNAWYYNDLWLTRWDHKGNSSLVLLQFDWSIFIPIPI